MYKNFISLSSVAFILSCSGSNGSGSDADNSSNISPSYTITNTNNNTETTFINLVNNDNGDIIKDASSDNFKISLPNRMLYSINRAANISDTFVDTNMSLFLNNQEFGEIILARSESNGKIAVLAWQDSTDSRWKFIDIATVNNIQRFTKTQNLVPLSNSYVTDENADDEFMGAVTIPIGNLHQGRVANADLIDFYHITTSSEDYHSVYLSDFGSSDLDLYIYDHNFIEIDHSISEETSENIRFLANPNAEYYIKVDAYALEASPQNYSIGVTTNDDDNLNNDATNSIQWQFTDGCNDGSRIYLRFYEALNESLTGTYWPEGNRVYVLQGTHTFGISCHLGTQICFGAENEDNSGSYWGVGLYGDHGCNECCYTCTENASTPSPKSLQCSN